MPLFSNIEAIQAQAEDGPTWSSAQLARAESLLAGVLDWIARNAPCLDTPDPNAPGQAEAKMIVAEAILRAIDSTGNIGSEGVGPSQVNYIDRAALPTLTSTEEAQLKALCLGATTTLPRLRTIRLRPGLF